MLMERRLIVSMETAQIMKKLKIFPGAEMFLVTFVWARSSDGLSFQENLYWSSELKVQLLQVLLVLLLMWSHVTALLQCSRVSSRPLWSW